MSPGNPQIYHVRHHYRYVYTSPVSNVKQRLIMIPPDRHGNQELVSFDLDVRGATGRVTVDWQSDPFGNRVCRVEAGCVEHAVDFEARFNVRHAPGPANMVERPDFAELQACLSYTALTAPDARVMSAAQNIESQTSTPAERLALAHEWAARSITYQVGVTGTQTPAAMALHLGHGVCQDYAHIMLSLLRTLGIPARYVSGHLIGEGAPHAWVEALLRDRDADPRSRIVACDPTHHRLVGDQYITVAVGRDFADVTSTSGVFTGSATGRLHWSKQAQAVEPSGPADAAGAAA